MILVLRKVRQSSVADLDQGKSAADGTIPHLTQDKAVLGIWIKANVPLVHTSLGQDTSPWQGKTKQCLGIRIKAKVQYSWWVHTSPRPRYFSFVK
jgi:hypothetical protein